MARLKTKKQAYVTYAPGSRVEIRDEEWIVRKCDWVSDECLAVHVTGVSELVRGKDAIYLSDLDKIVELRPEQTKLVHDPTPRYRRSRLYLEALLRKSPPTDNVIAVGHRAALDVTNYQMVPAHKALERPRARILMADGVGMGKTVEAGILLSELIRRGRGERILVVALKSILAQFQEELWARFTIPLVRLDSVGLQRIQRRIPASMNPFHHFNRCIISIDTLKKDTKYARYLEECRWDVVLVDECQNVAERGSSTSQRAKLAKLLANTADSLIFTSATPHDGKPESFASLMNLLDPTAIADPSDYGREDVRGLFVRRFKKDVAAEVGQAFRQRQIHGEKITAEPQEEVVLGRLEALDLRATSRGGTRSGSMLFTTTLKKAFLSSPRALHETIAERQKKLAKMADEAKDRPDVLAPIEHDMSELAALSAENDPLVKSGGAKLKKFTALLKAHEISNKRTSPRVVVFSERIATLASLADHLLGNCGFKPVQIATFNGSMDDRQQTEIIRDFGTEDSKVKVLLCSDAAAEGINLHFCCFRLFHYDIPWSLITLQQRNGRIDRYGQTEDPQIHYLLTIPETKSLQGDARILERLIEKEEYAQKNLGDVADLLQLHDASKEEETIAKGIEEKASPEDLIPDTPARDDSYDFLVELFANDDEESGISTSQEVPTKDPFHLIDDDLIFARGSLEEIGESSCIQGISDMQGFELIETPPDLTRRYAYLPVELDRKIEAARFTTDRDLVKEALAQSRKDANSWPKWQLFWELHPFSEWLTDRVLASFERHEAPLILVKNGLEPGEKVIVFQGQLANRRSRPVLVAWFGVSFLGASTEPHSIRDFENLARLSGLSDKKSLANPDKAIDGAPIEALLPQAVKRAKSHMSDLRTSRGQDILPWLKAEQRRRDRWKKKMFAIFANRESKVSNTTSTAAKKLAEDRRNFDREIDKHEDYLEQLRTADNPYLRVACVLYRGEDF